MQVRQDLRTAISIGIIYDSDGHVADMCSIASKTEQLSLTYTVAWCYVQLHLGGGGGWVGKDVKKP